MQITVLLDREGEYVRAKAQSFFMEEFFGHSKEQALCHFYSSFFYYLSLRLDLGEHPVDDVRDISFDIVEKV